MINGIIGRKVGMTQIFAEDGTVTPVTVIKAGPCVVVQTKTAAGKDGYNAVQLGLVEDKPIKLKNVKQSAQTVDGQTLDTYGIDGSITVMLPAAPCFFYMH